MMTIMLCIFDVDNASTALKSCAICTFCGTMRHALVYAKRIRMKRLHTSACLVAEVERAFVGPLRRAFDTTVEAQRFAFWVNDL